jgi:mannose/fructose-specific phosphotransferase system component IIA
LEEQDGILTYALTEADSIDDLAVRIDAGLAQLQRDSSGVLILVDLFGASPFNITSTMIEKYDAIDVVTGLNLPMLLEVILQRNNLTISEIALLAKEGGERRHQSAERFTVKSYALCICQSVICLAEM